jgi:hypothetical protein
MYKVVIASINIQQPGANGLGFWGAIGSGLLMAGKAVIAAAPSYISYKKGKDQIKLAKARFKAEQSAMKAQTAQMKIDYPPVIQPMPKPLPKANDGAIAQIMARLQIAINGGNQPPTSDYVPFVNPSQVPANAAQDVAKNEMTTTTKSMAIGAAGLVALMVLR